jgi:multidrug efflux pump subunit AcrA (membrane-fusion protein)
MTDGADEKEPVPYAADLVTTRTVPEPDEGQTREKRDEEESPHRRWLWWLLIIGLLALGIGGAAALYFLRQTPEPQPPDPQAPYVEYGRAVEPKRPLVITSNGIVEPRAEIGLSAEVPGRVAYVSPELLSGGRFDQGDVLIRIESEEYENRVREIEATVQERQVQLQRAQEEARIARRELQNLEARLAEDEERRAGAGLEADFEVAGESPGRRDRTAEEISPLARERPQLEAAEAALDGAKAALATARLDVERSSIEAPFDGHVRSEDVDIGQFVQPGQERARIYSAEGVEIGVRRRSRKAALIPGLFSLEAGGEAERVAALVTADFGGERFAWEGYVDRARGFIDERSRTVDAVIRVPDPFAPGQPVGAQAEEDLVSRPPLLVGTYTTVLIEGQDPERFLSIPAEALRGGDAVWALAEGEEEGEIRLRITPVEVVLRQDERVAIRAPAMPAGTLVVTSQIQAVTDGMAVRVRTRDESGGAGG